MRQGGTVGVRGHRVAGAGSACRFRSTTPESSGEALNPLKVIHTPMDSSQAAIGRVIRRETDETWSQAPKRLARAEATRSGAPIRPMVGMIRGTRRVW